MTEQNTYKWKLILKLTNFKKIIVKIKAGWQCKQFSLHKGKFKHSYSCYIYFSLDFLKHLTMKCVSRLGWCNETLQTGCLNNKTLHIHSQFWGLQGQDQGPEGLVSKEDFLPSLQSAFSLGPEIAEHSLLSPLKRTLILWGWAPPFCLHLTSITYSKYSHWWLGLQQTNLEWTQFNLQHKDRTEKAWAKINKQITTSEKGTKQKYVGLSRDPAAIAVVLRHLPTLHKAEQLCFPNPAPPWGLGELSASSEGEGVTAARWS